MKYDLLAAFRSIRSNPWMSLSVVITIALGIGINTSVFIFTDSVLFKPVPVENGDRLVSIRSMDTSKGEARRMNMSYPDFLDIKEEAESFENFELVNYWNTIVSEDGKSPERVTVLKVSAGLFEMIGETPVLGNGFNVSDGIFESPNQLLIGHSVWQSRFGGDADVVGKSVVVGEMPASIMGVMREGFRFPMDADYWMPLEPQEAFFDRKNRWIDAYGILKQGVSSDDAIGELSVLAKRIADAYPDTNQSVSVDVQTFHQRFNGGEIRSIFLIMLGAVGVVLLIACANVGNLMLSRGMKRRSEMSIRSSLGAQRWHLVRQMLVECVSLSVLGGLLGLFFTSVTVAYFDDWTLSVRPYWIQFSMDWRVLLYFSLITVGSGVVFGLVPALRSSKVDLSVSMKEDNRALGGRSKGRLIGFLVVGQFAMTMALLAGAGMMVRAYFQQADENSFLARDELLTARFDLPKEAGERYEEGVDRLNFFEAVMQQLAEAPGVSNAALTSHLPGRGASRRGIEIDGRPNVVDTEAPEVDFLVQSTNYFETIGLGLMQGRQFERTDDENAPKVAIASQEFVERHWPGELGIGKRFRFVDGEGDDSWRTIIGVAEDMNQRRGDDDKAPLVYLPLKQKERSRMYVMLRTKGDPLDLSHAAKTVIERLDSKLPLYSINTMDQVIERSLWMIKVFGSLFISFAAIALFMACMGAYAVVSQSTSRRTQEIGIRIALGARQSQVQRLVVARGMKQMGVGLLVGLLLAVGVSFLMSRGFLNQATPGDPFVLGGVSLVLVAVGVTACWLPARKGCKLDPAVALRGD